MLSAFESVCFQGSKYPIDYVTFLFNETFQRPCHQLRLSLVLNFQNNYNREVNPIGFLIGATQSTEDAYAVSASNFPAR